MASFKRINRVRGFSLLELLTLVAIIGIIATMATASFTGWLDKSNFTDQKSILYDILTRARNMANSRNECVRVTIDAQNVHIDSFSPGPAPNCADPLGAATISLVDASVKSGYTIETFSTGFSTVVFNSFGGLRETTAVTIYMSDGKGQRQGFSIYPALGQIRSVN